jgi:hypothetical protein
MSVTTWRWGIGGSYPPGYDRCAPFKKGLYFKTKIVQSKRVYPKITNKDASRRIPVTSKNQQLQSNAIYRRTLTLDAKKEVAIK